jgi:hypothetical protein
MQHVCNYVQFIMLSLGMKSSDINASASQTHTFMPTRIAQQEKNVWCATPFTMPSFHANPHMHLLMLASNTVE